MRQGVHGLQLQLPSVRPPARPPGIALHPSAQARSARLLRPPCGRAGPAAPPPSLLGARGSAAPSEVLRFDAADAARPRAEVGRVPARKVATSPRATGPWASPASDFRARTRRRPHRNPVRHRPPPGAAWLRHRRRAGAGNRPQPFIATPLRALPTPGLIPTAHENDSRAAHPPCGREHILPEAPGGPGPVSAPLFCAPSLPLSLPHSSSPLPSCAYPTRNGV
jgi:hypothetical protein